ncbi:2'-phosphotransferase [Malassezia yamatoensis]|uniref:2'-phosphotransferase n=1 Tax=Malassezia yamatoensis TaxID=253288 RepID=A0AAJ5YUR2_9BASI|nr:2'-phosphotransferase [Malassezia yamatoensis]
MVLTRSEVSECMQSELEPEPLVDDHCDSRNGDGPVERSREQAKQWKKERKLQAQQKKQGTVTSSNEAANATTKPGSGKKSREMPFEIQLSKALAYMLRHGAQKEFLAIRSDGYILVDSLLARPKIQKIQKVQQQGPQSPSVADVRSVVESSDKKRFELVNGSDTEPKAAGDRLWIRAAQGHSLGEVTDLDMVQLTPSNIDQYLAKENGTHYAIHGTDNEAWTKILESQALKKMQRNHIHLARGLPGSEGVISGMRKSCTRMIYIDMDRVIADGISVEMSSNGVILTAGKQGELPLSYVTNVRDSQGQVVWP